MQNTWVFFLHQPHFINLNHQPKHQPFPKVAFGKPARSSPLESSNSLGTEGKHTWIRLGCRGFSCCFQWFQHHISIIKLWDIFQPWIIKVFAYVVLIFFDQTWICQCVFVDVRGICWMSNWEPSFQHKQDPKNYLYISTKTYHFRSVGCLEKPNLETSSLKIHVLLHLRESGRQHDANGTFIHPASGIWEWPMMVRSLSSLYEYLTVRRIANIKKKNTRVPFAAWYLVFRWSCFSICVFWSVTKNKPCNDHL